MLTLTVGVNDAIEANVFLSRVTRESMLTLGVNGSLGFVRGKTQYHFCIAFTINEQKKRTSP